MLRFVVAVLLGCVASEVLSPIVVLLSPGAFADATVLARRWPRGSATLQATPVHFETTTLPHFEVCLEFCQLKLHANGVRNRNIFKI